MPQRRAVAAAALPVSSAARHRAALGLSLGIAGLALLTVSLSSSSSSPSFAAGPTAARPRGEAVALRAKRLDTTPKKEGRFPGYSTLDRDRLARRRSEVRLQQRELRKVGSRVPTLNYEMLPSVEDIYSREFTGNATTDPIGGRKRYSLQVAFKHDPLKAGPEAIKKNVLDYIWFFKNRMSCRSVEAKSMVSPIDGRSAVTSLEYPMKEYGEVPRGEKGKKIYQKAVFVNFDFYAPPDAIEYIRKRILADNMALRHMFLGLTRDFRDLGEDNELHL